MIAYLIAVFLNSVVYLMLFSTPEIKSKLRSSEWHMLFTILLISYFAFWMARDPPIIVRRWVPDNNRYSESDSEDSESEDFQQEKDDCCIKKSRIQEVNGEEFEIFD